MLNKKMTDFTLKEGLIVTAMVTGISLVPLACIGIWVKIQERKEAKKNKTDETETE